MVYNTTSAELILKMRGGLHQSLLKHALSATVGIGMGVAFGMVGYQRLIRYAPWFLGGIFVALILVLIPGVGMQINGARRWISIFGFSFQPSEFAKFLIPTYFIYLYQNLKEDLTFKRFLQWQCIMGVVLFVILIEPDNGTVGIIVVTLANLYFIMRIRPRFWAIPMLLLVLGGGLVASQMKHVPDRIRIYLHPELDLLGKGHQPYQAKIAAGSGGVFGRGFGESMQKLNYLPEARSDYIAAIFAEEFGFLGMMLLITLYATVALTGFSIAYKAVDQNAYYYASVLTFLITFQAFMNLGVVSGLLPSKGVNLPFFSQGGCSLAANFSMLALLIRIHAQNQKGRAHA